MALTQETRLDRTALAPRHWPTWLLVGMIGCCTWLPRPVALRIGAALGDLFFHSNAKRRHIARINIALCFPDLTSGQRERLVREHFRAYGRGISDLGLLWWAPEQRLREWVTIEGQTILSELLEADRRIVLFTPHAMGMDVGGVAISALYPAVSMMKRLRDPVLNHFVLGGRLRYPSSIMVMRDEGILPFVRAVRRGRIGYYIPDEDFGSDLSVFAPFFKVPTATLPVLGRIANLCGAAAVPCFTRLDVHSGRYLVTVEQPIPDFPTGNPVEDAARMNAALEAGIRAAPEQYMWTLRWFRTRPGDAPSPYEGTIG